MAALLALDSGKINNGLWLAIISDKMTRNGSYTIAVWDGVF